MGKDVVINSSVIVKVNLSMATTFIRVEHPIKYKKIDDALREANTITTTLNRYIKKGKISATALIAVSENNLKSSEAVIVKKKTGRPKKVMMRKYLKADGTAPTTKPSKTQPHLHIIIYSPKYSYKIADMLVETINKRQRANKPELQNYSTARRFAIKDPLYYSKYVIKQSIKIRYVNDYTQKTLFDFKKQHKLFVKVIDEGTYVHKKSKQNSPTRRTLEVF